MIWDFLGWLIVIEPIMIIGVSILLILTFAGFVQRWLGEGPWDD